MAKEYDVLCIGLIVVNLPVRPVNPGVFDRDVNLVDAITMVPGGDAMNEAIVLSKLGNKVGLIGKIGKDEFGNMLMKQAKGSRVDISNVKVDENANTSVCVVLIDEDGKRNFLSYRGANNLLSVKDIDLSVIPKTRILNIGSMFALPMLDNGGAEIILREAGKNRVITAADLKYDSFRIGFEGIKGTLPYIDYLMPSYDEAEYLTKEKEPAKMADILQQAGARTVVIKLGKEGCYIQSPTEKLRLYPYNVEVFDTTGAGDNFVAGFLTGVNKGWSLEKCGMFANAVASISVQNIGATTAVGSMEQVIEFINLHDSVPFI